MVQLTNEWIMLASSSAAMLFAGSIYLFPVYSSELGSPAYLNYSLAQLNTVGFLVNLGTWFGIIPGLIYDKFGPKWTSIIGGLLLAIGYFLSFAVVEEWFSVNYVVYGIYQFVAGQGSSALYVVALNTNALNFHPSNRGRVMGLMVCCFGLSAGFLNQMYQGFFHGSDIGGLLFFLTIAPAAAAAVAALLLKQLPQESEVDAARGARRLILAYCLAIMLALSIGGSGLVETFTDVGAHICAGVVIGIVCLYLTVLPAGTCCAPPSVRLTLAPPLEASDDKPLLARSSLNDPANKIAASPSSNKLAEGVGLQPTERNLIETMKTLEFWMLFLAFLLTVGSGIAVLDNVQPILQSRTTSTTLGKETSALVAVFSMCNTLGRMAFGWVSDRYNKKIGRAPFFVLACTMMTGAQIFLIFANLDLMYPAIAFMAVSYGGLWCICPTMTSELFGLANFGANFGAMSIAPALGSLFFSNLIVNIFFNRYATGGVCVDVPACYQYTLTVTAGCSAFAAFLALALHWRIKRRYGLPRSDSRNDFD